MKTRMQAKDIPDPLLLFIVNEFSQHIYPGSPDYITARWVMIWEIERVMEEIEPQTPRKVWIAKLARLVKRGLLDGCTCGCRGDFELTQKGKEFLAASQE